MPSSHLILWCPFLLLPSIFPSIRVYYELAVCIRSPKYWNFSHQSFQWVFSGGFLSDWLIWFPCYPRYSQKSSSTTFQNHKFFDVLPSLQSSSHNCTWPLERLKFWLYGHLSPKWCPLFNTLSRFVITFLPRIKCLLISGLQSPSAVILEPKKRKSATTSTFAPSICHEVMEPDAMMLVFLIFSFKPALSLSSFTLIKRLFSSSWLSALRVVSSAYLSLLMASLVPQRIKRLPAMQEARVRSLGWEDPPEKEMATHSSIIAWRIPWTEEPGGPQSMGSQSWTQLSNFTSLHFTLIPACNSSSPAFLVMWQQTHALEPVLCNKRGHRNEKPVHRNHPTCRN